MAQQASNYVGVGDQLPDITLPNLNGVPVSFDSFHGKKHILFMWASW